MQINFLDTYTPSILELNAQDVRSTREQLCNYTTISFPDIANNPGTVIGDLIITPLSYVITAVLLGIQNVLSDLSLENVANGVIYNCDFVNLYIKNFGVNTSEYYPSSGILRLVFSTNKNYELDRSTQFKIGDAIYSIYLPNKGNFTCLSTDSVAEEGTNVSRLKDTGSGMWFCDVPVIGKVGEVNIPLGTSADINVIIPELFSITALVLFGSGIILDSLDNLAKKTLTTMFSASLNTRYGAIQYVNTTCPFVESTYALRDGDKDLLRTYKNKYGIASGCLDIFARSKSYEFTEQQQVKLVLNSDTNMLEGEWNYVGQPYHLESITHPNVPVKDLDDREIYSTSDPQLGLGAVAAYTKYEKLFIKLLNNADFNLQLDDDGNLYSYFTVTYLTDPMLPAIQLTLENEDYAPINSNILVRGFIPVIISLFDIHYTKLPGVLPDLEDAKNRIKFYIGNLGAPNQFSIAEIARIMLESGVNYMKNIDVTAKVLWTIGSHIQNINGELEPVLDTQIKSVDELRVYYPNTDKTLIYLDMYACSPKIIRYFVLENAINFKEERDV